ncbi:MAG: transcriptional regulator [Hyphomicrobiales bacterium]|nr:MAG: transcriptional regulator [Hyphomicrobiales bacterium]
MARDNTYNRLNRLDLLTSRLKADELMTIGMLAAEFGVSQRTLSRDIAILRDRGLPIEADAGRGGGIRLHRTWGVGRLALNYQEAIELLFSIAIAEKLEAPWAFMNSSAIRRKLAASFSSTLRDRIKGLRERIHVAGTTSPQILSSFSTPQTDCMVVIFQAFLEMRLITITYLDVDSQSSRRTIEPHHLLICPPVWYLYAWDGDKSAVRCFRCDRIESVGLEDTPFPQRPYHLFESSIMKMGGSAI